MIFNQYFGHFLLDRGYIKKEQLMAALEHDNYENIKLGVLAVNAGYMTPKEVREVYLKQTKTDKVFGKIAVQEGYITQKELDNLLQLQRQNHLSICQVLLDDEILTLEQLSEALEEYKEIYRLTESQIAEVRQGKIDTLIMAEGTQPAETTIMTEYMALFSRNLIRFIDNRVRVESRTLQDPVTMEWVVHQHIHGDMELHTYIATDKNGYLELASRFAGESIETINKLARAAVKEFLNLHNNIFLVNQSNKAISMELEQSRTYTNAPLHPKPPMKMYTVFLSSSKIHIIISMHPAMVD